MTNIATTGIKRVVRDEELRRGDVIGVHRFNGLYDHYGIYTGNGEVIHYADPSGDFGTNIVVHRTTLKKFKEDAKYLFVVNFDKLCIRKQFRLGDIMTPYGVNVVKLLTTLFENLRRHIASPEETVQRAESRLGERKYNLATNNCEHFAIWCKTGVSESSQVDEIMTMLRNAKF